MFTIHRSERADALVDALVQVARQPLPDPFAAEVVAVPTRASSAGSPTAWAPRSGTSPGRPTGCAPTSSSRSRAGSSATCSPSPPASSATRTRGGPSGWCGRCSGPRPTTPASRGCAWSEPTWACADPARTATSSTGSEPSSSATARHIAELFDRYGVFRPDGPGWLGRTAPTTPPTPICPTTPAGSPSCWRRVRDHVGVASPPERIARPATTCAPDVDSTTWSPSGCRCSG
jgi:exodeoxyribonuclease V gamma subunit